MAKASAGLGPRSSLQERHLLETALKACDKLLDARDPVTSYEPIAEAARCVTRLRNHLIDQQRKASTSSETRLARVNSLLSLASSAEYPLVGIRWNRVCMLRDALKALLEDTPQAERG